MSAIRSENISADLALLEIGPINHSRRLTTANRLCRVWVSKQQLEGEILKNIKLIIEFIVGVYMPMWFKIGVEHRFTEGPRHILYRLSHLKHQSSEVVEIVMPTVQRST